MERLGNAPHARRRKRTWGTCSCHAARSTLRANSRAALSSGGYAVQATEAHARDKMVAWREQVCMLSAHPHAGRSRGACRWSRGGAAHRPRAAAASGRPSSAAAAAGRACRPAWLAARCRRPALQGSLAGGRSPAHRWWVVRCISMHKVPARAALSSTRVGIKPCHEGSDRRKQLVRKRVVPDVHLWGRSSGRPSCGPRSAGAARPWRWLRPLGRLRPLGAARSLRRCAKALPLSGSAAVAVDAHRHACEPVAGLHALRAAVAPAQPACAQLLHSLKCPTTPRLHLNPLLVHCTAQQPQSSMACSGMLPQALKGKEVQRWVAIPVWQGVISGHAARGAVRVDGAAVALRRRMGRVGLAVAIGGGHWAWGPGTAICHALLSCRDAVSWRVLEV